MTTFIVDISHHQSKSLDLAQTRRDGCECCLMKAGEGSTFVDPDFASNLAEARAAGQIPGAYWYQKANVSASAHVAAIQKVVPRDVPIILDVEKNSGGVDLTRQIINGLHAAGYRTPMLYLPNWYWKQIGSPSLVGLPPLWSSRYPDMNVGLLADEWGRVPASYWTGYGGLDVLMLQFTSSARIAGYQPLDASAFRGTRAELESIMLGTVSNKLTEEIMTGVSPQALPPSTSDQWVSFPLECGSNSSLIAAQWVTLSAGWGDVEYELITVGAGRTVVGVAGATPGFGASGTLLDRQRVVFSMPDGVEAVSLRYKSLTPSARLGIAFPQRTK